MTLWQVGFPLLAGRHRESIEYRIFSLSGVHGAPPFNHYLGRFSYFSSDLMGKPSRGGGVVVGKFSGITSKTARDSAQLESFHDGIIPGRGSQESHSSLFFRQGHRHFQFEKSTHMLSVKLQVDRFCDDLQEME